TDGNVGVSCNSASRCSLAIFRAYVGERHKPRRTFHGWHDRRDVRVAGPVVAQVVRHVHLPIHADQFLEVNPAVEFHLGKLLSAPALEVLSERGALVQRQRVNTRDIEATLAGLVNRVKLPDDPHLVLRAIRALDDAKVDDVHATRDVKTFRCGRVRALRTAGEQHAHRPPPRSISRNVAARCQPARPETAYCCAGHSPLIASTTPRATTISRWPPCASLVPSTTSPTRNRGGATEVGAS